MILIIGNTHDDVLYFESVMTNRKNERILGKYDIVTGSIYNQEVLLVHNVYTSYVSSALISYLISKYFVILVFVVGKCVAFTKDLKLGEILVGKQMYLSDVDQIDNAETKFGQIPGFPTKIETQSDIIGYLTNALDKRTFAHYAVGTIISSNVSYTNKEQFLGIDDDKSMFGENERIGLDSISGGVAIACNLFKVPFICVEVVGKHLGEATSVKNYSTVLNSYIGVGKAIVTCIGDIGRNEVIGVE